MPEYRRSSGGHGPPITLMPAWPASTQADGPGIFLQRDKLKTAKRRAVVAGQDDLRVALAFNDGYFWTSNGAVDDTDMGKRWIGHRRLLFEHI